MPSLAGCLETAIEPPSLRIAIALLPVPFFVWWLWTWMKGVGRMDELERRIELEALAFAFPIAVVLLMTLGLLDLATPLNPDDWSLRHVWAMMPVLYLHGPVAREAAVSVKNRLKVLRAERDWSQADLAERLGRVATDDQRD